MRKNDFFITYFMNRCRRYQMHHHGCKGCCLQRVRVDEWLIEGPSLAYAPDLH